MDSFVEGEAEGWEFLKGRGCRVMCIARTEGQAAGLGVGEGNKQIFQVGGQT